MGEAPHRAEARVEVRSADEVLELFGRRDQHLGLVRERFPTLSVVARNGAIRLSGAEEDVREAERVFLSLLHRVRRSEPLTPEVVLAELGVEPAAAAPALGAEEAEAVAAAGVCKARTRGQARYLELMDQREVVFALGPAGTGKTYLAVAKAVEALKRGELTRIVLCRPAVEAGEKLGFLPGDFHAKVNPYLRPLYDALNELLDPDTVRKLIEREVVEVVPLAFMRGRTLNRSFIILDEAQNTTAAQMKMFLTRMGAGSRIVVTGDDTQIDLPPGKLSGLIHVQRILHAIDGVGFIRLTKADIVRHPLVWRIVHAYERAEQRAARGES